MRNWPADLLGPSPVAPSVVEAMSRPVVGHLDHAFLQIMDEVAEDLRWLCQTENRMTFPVSGTGSGGAAVFNLAEPGDTIVVGVSGVFGGRIAVEGRGLERSASWGQAIPTANPAQTAPRMGPNLGRGSDS